MLIDCISVVSPGYEANKKLTADSTATSGRMLINCCSNATSSSALRVLILPYYKTCQIRAKHAICTVCDADIVLDPSECDIFAQPVSQMPSQPHALQDMDFSTISICAARIC